MPCVLSIGETELAGCIPHFHRQISNFHRGEREGTGDHSNRNAHTRTCNRHDKVEEQEVH
eukprot:3840706-Amphidinium_carterae.1